VEVFPGEFTADGTMRAESLWSGVHPTDLGSPCAAPSPGRTFVGAAQQGGKAFKKPIFGRAVPEWPDFREVFLRLRDGRAALKWQDVSLNTDVFEHFVARNNLGPLPPFPDGTSWPSSGTRSGRPAPTRSTRRCHASRRQGLGDDRPDAVRGTARPPPPSPPSPPPPPLLPPPSPPTRPPLASGPSSWACGRQRPPTPRPRRASRVSWPALRSGPPAKPSTTKRPPSPTPRRPTPDSSPAWRTGPHRLGHSPTSGCRFDGVRITRMGGGGGGGGLGRKEARATLRAQASTGAS